MEEVGLNDPSMTHQGIEFTLQVVWVHSYATEQPL